MVDDWERRTAAQIERSHPHWMVVWGCYSRMYWAFPRFPVPKGTIARSGDPERLLAEVDWIEAEAGMPSAGWRPIPGGMPEGLAADFYA